MSLTAALYQQFAKPEGALGRVAGWIMATRPSNRARNHWTLDLLNLQPSDHVLEIGFGPGLALARAATLVTEGKIVGIDHSEMMVRQAALRNAAAISKGIMILQKENLEQLQGYTDCFDKVLSVNVFQFFPDHKRTLESIRKLMKTGALLATTYMPRHRKATALDADLFADALVRDMAKVGFRNIRIEKLALKPMPVVCVLGNR